MRRLVPIESGLGEPGSLARMPLTKVRGISLYFAENKRITLRTGFSVLTSKQDLAIRFYVFFLRHLGTIQMV
jgi:hypothetical protein